MTICLANDNFFELKINRKTIKNAYIRVKPNKVIELSVPKKMPDDLITDLIKQKTSWIISVSDTLGNNFDANEIRLMPVPQNQIDDLKYEAEVIVYESLQKVYPLVKKYGIEFPEHRVRYMTTRWGSCVVNKKRIWINVYLVKLPPQCLDYVVLHELIHFIRPDHSDKFYSLLDELMPGWKECKKILKRVKLPSKEDMKRASQI